LEGKTRDEAARELGWSLGTLRGRLERGRTLLRNRLARRGLTLSATLLGAAVAPTASAMPAGLAASTAKAAARFLGGRAGAGVVSARVVALTDGVLRTMFLTRVKIVVLAVLVVTALGAGLVGRVGSPSYSSGAEQRGPGGTDREEAAVVALDGPVADPTFRHRIVFVGDSSTDGNTYQLLIRQALAEAGRPVPACINAGVAMDTAKGVRERLERDVFVHRPDLVVLSVGIADVLWGPSSPDYEADIRATIEQLQSKGVPVLILTTGLLGPDQAEAEARLEKNNALLLRLADETGCLVGDVNRAMENARAAGKDLVEADGCSPTFEGHRLIARTVLDALRRGDVTVPRELLVGEMPVIVKEWRLQVSPMAEPGLDAKQVAALDPEGADWTTYTLPEKGPADKWWDEQERKRGFAFSLG